MTSAPEEKIVLAQEYMAQNKVYEAIRELETLIEEQPSHFEGHILLGLLNFKLGAIPRGREFMEKALGLAPTKEERNKVDMILREQKQLDKRRYYRPDFEALRKQNND